MMDVDKRATFRLHADTEFHEHFSYTQEWHLTKPLTLRILDRKWVNGHFANINFW